MPKAILYARFSPRPNAESCESVESQLHDLRAYCVANELDIAGEFADKSLTGGSDWDQRPGMLDATRTAKPGMVFLVRAYDRLFRDVDKATMFRAMLEAKGIEVRSITEPGANGGGMNAKLIRFVFLWIAEYQREITKARTKAKMLEHQAGGRRMSHETPYGWAQDPDDEKRMVACEDELATIVLIKQWHEAGTSLRAIARRLDERGVRPRTGERWHHQQIRRILSR